MIAQATCGVMSITRDRHVARHQHFGGPLSAPRHRAPVRFSGRTPDIKPSPLLAQTQVKF
jgi:hypothetical protein